MKLTLRPDPNSLVGKVGRAVTDLKPQGRVLVQGFEYDAHTSGLFYPAGTEVVVVDVEQLGLLVRVPSDPESLDALVGIHRPKSTPRWGWWSNEEDSGEDLSFFWAVCCVAVAVLLVLAVTGWLLFRG
jgi:hypothetical protein